MAQFSFPQITLSPYPFDYHSHFGGILPVEKDVIASADVTVSYSFGKSHPTLVELREGQQLSLAGLFGGLGPDAVKRGTVELFVKALQLMISSDNPLLKLANKGRNASYERGECIAETIYIAAIYLARRWGIGEVENAWATKRDLYEAVLGALPERVQTDPSLLSVLRYFNSKIYSANKYTPFDDAYKARSFAIKEMLKEKDGEDKYLQWILMTLRYLQQEGIVCSQMAIGEDEIRPVNAIISAYNASYGTQYFVLAHTSAVYGVPQALETDLQNKLLPLFQDKSLTNVIGIDLLGTENKVGNYGEFFNFIAGNQQQLTQFFGPGGRSATFIGHIHCGEGAGTATDNRSAIGYYFLYSPETASDGFYRAFSQYVKACSDAALVQHNERRRATAGTRAPRHNVSGLFDELFRNDCLTYGGVTLRRYDGNSERTRELVAYHGKRNMMALTEILNANVPNTDPPLSWYPYLTGLSPGVSLRLGHAYYYRSYIAGEFPKVAFDTNLGSNAITGASGLFSSPEGYRINRGFRHLDGYVDTDTLHAVLDTVAYMGDQLLSAQQSALFFGMVKAKPLPASISDLLANEQTQIQTALNIAMGPIASQPAMADVYTAYSALVSGVVGNVVSPTLWYSVMVKVFSLFQNWRSYLLGADGQGVEHTNIQNEQLRMVLMLAYALLPDRQDQLNVNTLNALQSFLVNVSTAYWQMTVAPSLALPAANGTTLATISGFKGPASVVTVTRSKVASS